MKIIKYQIVTEANCGTEDTPDMKQVFSAVEIQCSDENLEANLAVAQKEACNGEVTVEEITDEDTAPTAEERIAGLEAQNGLLTQQVAALSSQLDFQEECLVEMAGMVYA